MALVIGNAAGTVKTLADAEEALRGPATKIKIGSITLNERRGNIPAPRVYHFDQQSETAVNALGLPNQGANATLAWLPNFYRECRAAGKQLEVSVAGFSPEDYARLFNAFDGSCDLVELNLGCPNVYGTDAERKPIPSYDPDLFAIILKQVKAVKSRAKVGVKVSPVRDTTVLSRLARVIWESEIVTQVVGVNTEPGAQMLLPDGSNALGFRATEDGPILHGGGMSGRPLRESTSVVMKHFMRHLPEHIRLIACGGIFTSADLMGYHKDFDPDGYELGTAYYERGQRAVGDIVSGLPESMLA